MMLSGRQKLDVKSYRILTKIHMCLYHYPNSKYLKSSKKSSTVKAHEQNLTNIYIEYPLNWFEACSDISNNYKSITMKHKQSFQLTTLRNAHPSFLIYQS